MRLNTYLGAVAVVLMTMPPALAQSAQDAGQFISNARPGDWRASKLDGLSIYGVNDESIGKVSDVILDKSGSAKMVVISLGGVLGIGAKTVALPFSAIQWSDEPMVTASISNAPGSAGGSNVPATTAMNPTATTPSLGTATQAPTQTARAHATLDYPDHGSIKFTKDQLKKAPDFHYASENK